MTTHAPFYKVAIGDIFTTGYSKTRYNERAYCVFEKINKIQGRCIEQWHFGNERAVNHVYNFSPNSIVYSVEV